MAFSDLAAEQADLTLNHNIESQIKVAIGRVATAFETELKKLEERFDKKYATEMEILSRDVREIGSRLTQVPSARSIIFYLLTR